MFNHILSIFFALGLFLSGSVFAASGLQGSIVGKITNAANSQAIQGAQVSAKLGSQVIASATSNATGDYVLADLAVGTYSLQVSASGYQMTTKDNIAVAANATTTVNFALQTPPAGASGSLTGQVVNAMNGAPIESALEVLKKRMSIPLLEDVTEEVVLRTTTNAEGKYSFSQVETGIYSLRVTAEGFHATKVKGIAVLVGEATVLNVALLPKEEKQDEDLRSGSITGMVIDAESGKPIAGAAVFFTPSHGQDRDGHERRFALTDEDGTYTLEGVLVGIYQLHARVKGYSPTKIEGVKVQAEQTTSVDFALNPLLKGGAKAHSDEGDDAKDKAKEAKEKGNERAGEARQEAQARAEQNDGEHHGRGRGRLEVSGHFGTSLKAQATAPLLTRLDIGF